MSIAIITGGSRGLGRNTAEHLAKKGVDVIITYRKEEGEAAELVKRIVSQGRKALALPLDVGDANSFPAFVETVRRQLRETFGSGTFDYLVNNGGHGVHALLAETTEEQFDQMMNVHLKGPFFLTQKLLPLMADGGRIINISSGLARFTLPGYGAYATMKGGLEVMTRYLAKELGERQITANIVAPGAIETDFQNGAVRDNPALNKMIASSTALGRVGVPDDVGPMIASLLGPENRWVNAQRIEVSGGTNL